MQKEGVAVWAPSISEQGLLLGRTRGHNPSCCRKEVNSTQGISETGDFNHPFQKKRQHPSDKVVLQGSKLLPGWHCIEIASLMHL